MYGRVVQLPVTTLFCNSIKPIAGSSASPAIPALRSGNLYSTKYAPTPISNKTNSNGRVSNCIPSPIPSSAA